VQLTPRAIANFIHHDKRLAGKGSVKYSG
jgi:hypothetical protein